MTRTAEERLTTAADIVRRARHNSDMTQAELADRACVARTVVSEVERGRRQPSVVTLQRLVAGAGYCVELRLFRPDPLGIQMSGPIGEVVVAARDALLAVAEEKGVGRIWVSGPVATARSGGTHTWNWSWKASSA